MKKCISGNATPYDFTCNLVGERSECKQITDLHAPCKCCFVAFKTVDFPPHMVWNITLTWEFHYQKNIMNTKEFHNAPHIVAM